MYKFSPSLFPSVLLLSRKRTFFFVIFIALFISKLLKLRGRAASWGSFCATQNETQNPGQLISSKVQANARELRKPRQLGRADIWGEIGWAKWIAHRKQLVRADLPQGGQLEAGTVPMTNAYSTQRRRVWVVLFWPQNNRACRESGKQLVQSVRHVTLSKKYSPNPSL